MSSFAFNDPLLAAERAIGRKPDLSLARATRAHLKPCLHQDLKRRDVRAVKKPKATKMDLLTRLTNPRIETGWAEIRLPASGSPFRRAD
jgi:hypothetical protein